MKNYSRYLIFIFALCLYNVGVGQTDSDSTTNGSDLEKGLVKTEGGSANRGAVYYFYEKILNIGIPDLRFIDTSKSLFHRYDPYMKNNRFRTDRGNVGLIADDLEYSYQDNILFSYGKSPFELYRYTPFNTKFYQNVVPYVEMFYVMAKEREQDFRVLYTQNALQGLNVGAEYNVINSPGVYSRTYTRHNNIRLFSNYISKDKHYRAVAGYYFNKFEANESDGILISYDSLKEASLISNKKIIPVKLQRAENIWKENSFYLKQSYHFGINRKVKEKKASTSEKTNVNGNEEKNEGEEENENKDNENENEDENEKGHPSDLDTISELNIIPKLSRNFGYLSHAIEITRFRTMYNDRQFGIGNYPAVFRDSTQTLDSTFVDLMRNTVSLNFGDVTSYQNSQFFNVSVGVIVDLAKVRTGDVVLDTNKSNPFYYYEDFNRDFNYFYPFARMRLNYKDQYFLTVGAISQTDLHHPSGSPSSISINAGLDYFFGKTNFREGVFAEFNFSDVRPRPFQEFYISNNYLWDYPFENTQTTNLAVGARWKGFHLRAEHTIFNNYIYLTPIHFEQADQSFSIFKTTLEKTFKFLSILAFDTRLVYQQNTSETFLQLPKFATRSALYFDFNLLGTTPVQAGVEVYYNTPFYSRFYNPTLGSFYDQRELETGGFAYMDAFLNLRVQRANLFLKFTNAGADFMGYNYMMTKGYPVI
ncbi:MAG: hypothetical protein LBP96_03175, partial [Bacteroidales bacterium]|nr:hypothetical protein [Bacteroidales bacterium]